MSYEILSGKNGFEKGQSDTTLTWDRATRTVSVSPTGTFFKVFVAGRPAVFTTTQSVSIPNTTGLYVFYFDEKGVLTQESVSTIGEDIIKRYALVGVVYWNATQGREVLFGDERHGLMNAEAHSHFHSALGAQVKRDSSEGIFNLTGIEPDTGGDVDSDAWISLEGGTLLDEDVILSTASTGQNLGTGTGVGTSPSVGASIPTIFKYGATGEWFIQDVGDKSGTYPMFDQSVAAPLGVTYTGARQPWNEFTGATWQLSEVGNNDYVLLHLFAWNSTTSRVVAVMGQATYGTVGDAREGARSELNNIVINDLPLPEFRPLYTIIVESANADSNAVKCDFDDFDDGSLALDWRFNNIGAGASSGAGGASGVVSLQNAYNSGNVIIETAGRPISLSAASTIESALTIAQGIIEMPSSLVIGTGASANGASGIAIGPNANAGGLKSIAIGDAAVAEGEDVVAIGQGLTTAADLIDSVVIGSLATALRDGDAAGNLNVVVGYAASTYGYHNTSIGASSRTGALGAPINAATAVGRAAVVSLAAGTAIGYGAQAVRSVAVGYNVNAGGNLSVAIGDQGTESSGSSSVAIGYLAKGTASGAISIGNSSDSTGSRSVAIGELSQALNSECVVIGDGAVANNAQSVVIGDRATVSGNVGVAIGRDATVDTGNTTGIAIGFDAKTKNVTGGVTATDSLAIGRSALAQGSDAVAIGYAAKVLPLDGEGGTGASDNSTAVGRAAETRGSNASAFGILSKARNTEAFSAGYNTISEGLGSVAIGTGSWAQVNFGIAIGRVARVLTGANDSGIAIGDSAQITATHVTSSSAIAIGTDARAEGNSNIAIGATATVISTGTGALNYIDSIAIGRGSTITASNSVAIGHGTDANAANSTVLGVDAYSGGPRSVIIGSDANNVLTTRQSTDDDVISVGWRSAPIGARAIAFGREASTGGVDAIAIGYLADAAEEGAIAIGQSANTTPPLNTANYAIAIGHSSTSNQDGSIAIGQLTRAEYDGNIAIGVGAQALSQDGVALGPGARAGVKGVSIGKNTGITTAGTNSTLVGLTTNGGTSSVAVGITANAGTYGIAIGASAVSSIRGIAIGHDSDAGAYQATIGGNGSTYIIDLALGNTNQVSEYNAAFIAERGVTVHPTHLIAGVADLPGQNLILAGARSTGGGAGGSVIISTAPAGTPGGTAVNALVERFEITGAGSWLVGAAPASGTAGQVLTSQGPNGPPEWVDAAGGGEANTASNLGAGTGVFASKVSEDLQFKSLVAGSNVSISSDASTITINATDTNTGEVNTGSSLGAGNAVFAGKVGVDLQFKSLVAGANMSLSNDANTITITGPTPGQTNTASNLGAGTGIYASKSGVDLRFKSLVAGSNVSITNDANTITINASVPAPTVSLQDAYDTGRIVTTTSSSTPVTITANASASPGLRISRGWIEIDDPIKIGSGSYSVLGTSAIAIGVSANAAGIDAVGLGVSASASGQNAIAIGNGAQATQANAVAIGGHDTLPANATGQNSVAIGYDAIANQSNTIAIGRGPDATGSAAIAIGSLADATGDSSVAIGEGANAGGTANIAIGLNVSMTGTGSIGLGAGAASAGNQRLIVGSQTYPIVNCYFGHGESSSAPGSIVVLRATNASSGSGASATNLSLRGGTADGAGTGGDVELVPGGGGVVGSIVLNGQVSANASVGQTGDYLVSRGPGLSPNWRSPIWAQMDTGTSGNPQNIGTVDEIITEFTRTNGSNDIVVSTSSNYFFTQEEGLYEVSYNVAGYLLTNNTRTFDFYVYLGGSTRLWDTHATIKFSNESNYVKSCSASTIVNIAKFEFVRLYARSSAAENFYFYPCNFTLRKL